MSHHVRIIGTYYIAFGDYLDVREARLEGEPDKVLVTESGLCVVFAISYENGVMYRSWFE